MSVAEGCVLISDVCKEEYTQTTKTMLKERLNNYIQHIRQPELQQIDVEGYIRICGLISKLCCFLQFGRKKDFKRVILEI